MDQEMVDITVPRDIDYTVVDVDAHYTGEFEDLVEYVDDGPWRQRVSDAVDSTNPVKGFWPKITSADDTYRTAGKGESISPETIPTIMDKLQIDKILFLGNQMITFDQMKADDARPTVYANAYADYLLEEVVDPSKGIYATIPVPYQAPEEAAELIDRVGGEKGIVATCFIASMTEPPLGNRRYDVIYDAAERQNLPVIIHGGTPGVDSFYLSGFSHRLETHTLAFVWANMAQLTSIIAQGVPEKFPGIEFVFQEAGLFYIPMMMYRMDAEYLQKPHEAPLLNKLPSEYMKEFYYGTQPMEEPARQSYFGDIIEMIGGAERVMYASDYPHADYDAPNVITDMPFLSESEKELILGKNAEEVFGI